jgi:hypothetical protein
VAAFRFCAGRIAHHLGFSTIPPQFGRIPMLMGEKLSFKRA